MAQREIIGILRPGDQNGESFISDRELTHEIVDHRSRACWFCRRNSADGPCANLSSGAGGGAECAGGGANDADRFRERCGEVDKPQDEQEVDAQEGAFEGDGQEIHQAGQPRITRTPGGGAGRVGAAAGSAAGAMTS